MKDILVAAARDELRRPQKQNPIYTPKSFGQCVLLNAPSSAKKMPLRFPDTQPPQNPTISQVVFQHMNLSRQYRNTPPEMYHTRKNRSLLTGSSHCRVTMSK